MGMETGMGLETGTGTGMGMWTWTGTVTGMGTGMGTRMGMGQGRGQTWLPSFCQNTAGGGLPLLWHWKVTLWPGVTVWSRGPVTSWGGTAAVRGEKRARPAALPAPVGAPSGTHTPPQLTVHGEGA